MWRSVSNTTYQLARAKARKSARVWVSEEFALISSEFGRKYQPRERAYRPKRTTGVAARDAQHDGEQPAALAEQQQADRGHQEKALVACHYQESAGRAQGGAGAGRNETLVVAREQAGGKVNEHHGEQGLQRVLHPRGGHRQQRREEGDRRQHQQAPPAGAGRPSHDVARVEDQADRAEDVEYQRPVFVNAEHGEAGRDAQRPEQRGSPRTEAVQAADAPNAVTQQGLGDGHVEVAVVDSVDEASALLGFDLAHHHREQDQKAQRDQPGRPDGAQQPPGPGG